MPSQRIHIGPFAAVYVGRFGDSDVLTQLSVETTGVHEVNYNVPEVFAYAIGNSIQSGPATISARINFLSDDENVVKLAAGNFFDAATQDTPSAFEKLVVLLAYPDEDAESSILLPECYCKKNIPLRFGKSEATSIPLEFYFQSIDRFDQLYYKRTLADLATILGARSPV